MSAKGRGEFADPVLQNIGSGSAFCIAEQLHHLLSQLTLFDVGCMLMAMPTDGGQHHGFPSKGWLAFQGKTMKGIIKPMTGRDPTEQSIPILKNTSGISWGPARGSQDLPMNARTQDRDR